MLEIVKLRSQSLQVGPMGSQGVPGATGPQGLQGLPGGVLISPVIPVSAAEIKAADTVRKVLIAGVLGTVYLPVGLWIVFHPGVTPYGGANGNLVVGWGNLLQGFTQIDARAVLGIFSGNTTTENFLLPATAGVSDPQTFVGEPWTLQLVAAALLGTGTLSVSLAYIPI